ncbi:MAG TPA: single-stranded DNA-binding protein [Pseudonocardiaceae bacterium]|nr:single-stranded DNA-binding protein [Pseudonocardiaceae bacterium]
MALNQTTTTIVGRLASDPNHKLTMNDVDVTHFRLASNERRYDRQANQWVNGDQLFIDVTCWRRLAFNVKACLAKGDPVVVHGRLYTSEYEVDGKRRSETRMEAQSVGPDLGRITTALRRRPKPDGDGADAATAVASNEASNEASDEASNEAPGEVSDEVTGEPIGEAPQPAAEQVPELAGPALDDRPEQIDELARQLLEQPPGGADAPGRRSGRRKEALMAGV